MYKLRKNTRLFTSASNGHLTNVDIIDCKSDLTV